VLIFRLVSRHTIESKIMQRASEKRQLEALVIAKGGYEFNLTLITSDSHIASLPPPYLLRMRADKNVSPARQIQGPNRWQCQT